MRIILYYIVIIGVVFNILSIKPAHSAEEKKPKITVVKKQVIGTVSGISKNFIAVEYAYDGVSAKEIALNIAKDVESSHRKLSEIGLGDIVAVTYEETFETKEGEKPRLIKREAKIVEFRKAAPKTPEDKGLLSREGESGMPIKGIR